MSALTVWPDANSDSIVAVIKKLELVYLLYPNVGLVTRDLCGMGRQVLSLVCISFHLMQALCPQCKDHPSNLHMYTHPPQYQQGMSVLHKRTIMVDLV